MRHDKYPQLDGTVRVLIVPDSMKSSGVFVQMQHIEMVVAAKASDDIYAELVKVTQEAIRFYNVIESERNRKSVC